MTDSAENNKNEPDDYKKVLFEAFVQQYRNLCSFINRLSINGKIKENIIHHFDEGFLWSKEAFYLLEMNDTLKVDELKKEESIINPT